MSYAEEKKINGVGDGGFNVLGKWVWKGVFSEERIQNYVLHCQRQALDETFD